MPLDSGLNKGVAVLDIISWPGLGGVKSWRRQGLWRNVNST